MSTQRPPADQVTVGEATEPSPDELLARAAELGIKADRTWTLLRLFMEIAEAEERQGF